MKQIPIKLMILMLALLLVLTACGGNSGNSGNTGNTGNTGSTTPSTGGGGTSTPSGNQGGGTDGKVYTLSFASTVAPGSMRNVGIEVPFSDLLAEKSGGRIKLEIYPNSTLTAQNEAWEALTNGVADFSYVVYGMYPGQFPYNELYCTPGLVLGNTEESDSAIREYTNKYFDSIMDEVKLITIWNVGNVSVISNKEINSVADFKGLRIRMPGSFIPLFESIGASPVAMPAAEVYESIRLNVIDAAVAGFTDIASFRFGEVTDHCIIMPIARGGTAVCMSWDAYNSLPADLQAVVDEVCEDMNRITTEYNLVAEEATIKEVHATNAGFKFKEMSGDALVEMNKACLPLIEAKAGDLDKAGLKGADALNWLKSKSKIK